tara:strand:+ start:465 stop:689 length:225 start_codon:yes stop_codon:yes gene_type:complete
VKVTKNQIRRLIREAIQEEMDEMMNKDQKVWVGQTYQRDEDDETADEREDHNIDDLYAMVRDLERKVDSLKDKK